MEIPPLDLHGLHLWETAVEAFFFQNSFKLQKAHCSPGRGLPSRLPRAGATPRGQGFRRTSSTSFPPYLVFPREIRFRLFGANARICVLISYAHQVIVFPPAPPFLKKIGLLLFYAVGADSPTLLTWDCFRYFDFGKVVEKATARRCGRGRGRERHGTV